MITGLWSNPNYDDNKNTRKQALDEIEQSYNDIIMLTYDRLYYQKQDEAMRNDPFFAPVMDLDQEN